MKKFSLKKTAFCAVVGTLSLVAIQKMYHSSKGKKEQKKDANLYRFSHRYPEDSAMQTVSEEHFVEEVDLPKKRVLKP